MKYVPPGVLHYVGVDVMITIFGDFRRKNWRFSFFKNKVLIQFLHKLAVFGQKTPIFLQLFTAKIFLKP
jgi:hypothetical protein